MNSTKALFSSSMMISIMIRLQFLLLLFSRIQAIVINRSCPKKCWNGNHCSDTDCRDCFFSCPNQTCRPRQDSCKTWCHEYSDCSKYKACRGCIFCRNAKESCPIATFKVNGNIFNSEDDGGYWDQWLHSGKPYFHSGPPLFFDINNDNNLDYFNPMHGHETVLSGGFGKRVELGIGTKQDGEYSIRQYSDRILCTDIDCDKEVIDTHGSIVMDLDGDGVLDIYISNGGGLYAVGENRYPNFSNWLFWGETHIDTDSGETFIKFVGGRDESRKANLDMEVGRGRFNYIFDANNDGLLDVFASQDRRASNLLKPGILLINQGNRTWKEDEGMKEYARSMILTDADGDGLAQEFFIQRSFCYPQRPGPGVDSSQPELGPYDSKVKQFCNTRPVGTPAVYRYNNSKETMEEVSQPYSEFWAGKKWTNSCCPNGAWDGNNDCNARSVISGDFDDDQIADHILLYKSKMLFFFSSDRQRGALPDSSAYIGLEIKLPSYCAAGNSIHPVDIDNDGREELLVSCSNPGVYILYTRGVRKNDWTLDNGCNGKGALGDLSNRFFGLPSKLDMKEFCNKYSNVRWPTMKKICNQFSTTNRLTFTKTDGVSIIDINNDGFRDIVATNSFGYLRFYINTPTAKTRNNKFIGFRVTGDVTGSKSNRYGIGATVILFAMDRDGNMVKQFREISTSQHHTDKYG